MEHPSGGNKGKAGHRITRWILTAAGSLSLLLGVLGLFLPLLPTTPFLLLAAALYYRGSSSFYDRLMAHRTLGAYIVNFREKKAIPRRGKVACMVLLWLSMSYCIFFVVPYLWLKLLLAGIAAGVSVHVLSYKTLK